MLVVSLPDGGDEDSNGHDHENGGRGVDNMIAEPIGMAAVEKLPDKDESITPLLNFLMASVAGILASIVTHPFDVLRTQMQLWTYKPDGYYQRDPFLKTLEDSKINQLQKSVSVDRISRSSQKALEGNHLLVETPSVVPKLSSDKVKPFLLELHTSCPQRPIPRGARLSPQSIRPGLLKPGVIRFTYNLISTEGFSVFWRGLLPRLARRTIATAMAWTAFEELNQRFVQAFTYHGLQDPSTVRRS